MVMATIRMALMLLGSRALAFLALVGALAAFAITVAYPSTLRIVAASLFTVIVFLPALWADVRKAN